MILITGGAGFIGSNIAAALAEDGLRVSICDWLGTGGKWTNLEGVPLDEIVDPDRLGEFLGWDPNRAGPAWSARGQEVELVIHMGAISATTETDTDLIVETNYRLSQALWHWCTARRVPLIYASSAATYGDGTHGFVDDPSDEALARLRPLNAYGWSKHLFDRWVGREVRSGEGHAPPQWVGLKFFNVYGPREEHKGDMRSVVTKALPGAVRGAPATLFRSHHPDYADGGQLRDFVYVRDCVQVVKWFMQNRDVSGLFNVGSGRAQSFRELISALYDAVGTPLEIDWVDTPEEIRDKYQYFTQADLTRLREAGYDKPFASVEEGVADYVGTELRRSGDRPA